MSQGGVGRNGGAARAQVPVLRPGTPAPGAPPGIMVDMPMLRLQALHAARELLAGKDAREVLNFAEELANWLLDGMPPAEIGQAAVVVAEITG